MVQCENSEKHKESGCLTIQFSCSVVSDSLQPHKPQHTRHPTPRVYPNSRPLSRWCQSIISSSVVPISSHLHSFPASGSFQMSPVLCIRWPKDWSFSFSISPSSKYSGLISFKDGLAGSPCSLRDSQESSPTPQFKSISSSVAWLLYGPILISVQDYWKDHSLD